MAAAGPGGGNTFTDFLITVFSTQGLNQYQRDLQKASTALLGLAAQFSGLGAASYSLFFAFYRSGPAVQFLATSLLVLTGILRHTNEAFVSFEQTNFRLSVALAQSGLGDSIQQWREYANARQDAMGIDREATMALAAQLLQLRFTREETLKLIPAIQAAALAMASASGGRINPASLASQIAKGVAMGEQAQLLELGLDVQKIERSADRVSEIHRQLVEKFGAAGEAALKTLFHDQEEVNNNWKRFMEDFGGVMRPFQAAWADLKNAMINVLRLILLIIAAVQIPSQLFLRAIGAERYYLGTEAADSAMNQEARRNQGRMVNHLRNIDNKMDQFTTTMARAVLGATGTRIREAATIRNFTPLSRQAF